MPNIFILVEHIDGLFVATPHDESGPLTDSRHRVLSASSRDQDGAVRRAKRLAVGRAGRGCEFTVEPTRGK